MSSPHPEFVADCAKNVRARMNSLRLWSEWLSARGLKPPLADAHSARGSAQTPVLLFPSHFLLRLCDKFLEGSGETSFRLFLRGYKLFDKRSVEMFPQRASEETGAQRKLPSDRGSCRRSEAEPEGDPA